MARIRVSAFVWCLAVLVASSPRSALAQQDASATPPSTAATQGTGSTNTPSSQLLQDVVFDMGKIVVVGSEGGLPGVGGAVLTSDQMWTFDRNSLDKAVNVVPDVVSTFDANGRRNESDIFVRGFGRWQVPLIRRSAPSSRSRTNPRTPGRSPQRTHSMSRPLSTSWEA